MLRVGLKDEYKFVDVKIFVIITLRYLGFSQRCLPRLKSSGMVSCLRVQYSNRRRLFDHEDEDTMIFSKSRSVCT